MGKMSDITNVKRYTIVPDVPNSEDRFDGVHGNVADTIVDLVQNPSQSGISIGIDGARGSGKSSVIKMIAKKLNVTADNSPYNLVTIDTWSHSGDHLRRACLEKLADSLLRKGWTKNINWNLDSLQRDRSNSIPAFSKIIALIVVLIFVWLLFPEDIQRDVLKDINAYIDIKFPVLQWMGFAIGIIGFLIWVFLYPPFVPKLIQALSGNVSEFDIREAVEEAEHSSWRFQQWFYQLLKQSLDAPERKLIIVFDNLDRLENTEALEVWKTLQIFFERFYNPDEEQNFLKNVFFISCYDSSQLEQQSLGHFEKLFHTRFAISPLLISSWKPFFIETLAECGFDSKEQELVMDALLQIEAENLPKPRKLVRCANELATLKMQNPAESLEVLLCYWYELNNNYLEATDEFLSSTKAGSKEIIRTEFLERLRNGNFKINSWQILGLNSNVAAERYAQVYFGLPRLQALQAVLHGPISDALRQGNYKRLIHLEQNAVGYIDVLHLEVNRFIQRKPMFSGLEKAIVALFNDESPRSHAACAKMLIEGLGLMSLDLRANAQLAVDYAMSCSLLLNWVEDNPLLRKKLLRHLSLFKHEEEAEHLSSNLDSWIKFYSTLCSLVSDDDWALCAPSVKSNTGYFDELISTLVEDKRDQLSAEKIKFISGLKVVGLGLNLNPLKVSDVDSYLLWWRFFRQELSFPEVEMFLDNYFIHEDDLCGMLPLMVAPSNLKGSFKEEWEGYFSEELCSRLLPRYNPRKLLPPPDSIGTFYIAMILMLKYQPDTICWVANNLSDIKHWNKYTIRIPSLEVDEQPALDIVEILECIKPTTTQEENALSYLKTLPWSVKEEFISGDW
ncbi:P-loop NTPase fold protein [Curvivirga sp.]|uniref:P-loop NTPase fold protein n=1 Tax=Curvivirga sp. TaxID=2856848 RepID=UPI003B5A609A